MLWWRAQDLAAAVDQLEIPVQDHEVRRESDFIGLCQPVDLFLFPGKHPGWQGMGFSKGFHTYQWIVVGWQKTRQWNCGCQYDGGAWASPFSPLRLTMRHPRPHLPNF